MKKKLLLVCLATILAASAVIGGTLAYFTDQDNNTNTFTMGNISIALDEAKVEKGESNTWTAKNERVKGNTYENIYPGAVLPKDPTVHNTGSNDAYVRVKITIPVNALTAMQKDGSIATDSDADLKSIIDIDTGNWSFVSAAVNNATVPTVTYIYNYSSKLAVGESTSAVFTRVAVPTFITNEASASVGSFSIDIVAEAIQSDGFADSAAAFSAFDAN